MAMAGRLLALSDTLRYTRYLDDFPVSPINHLWEDTVTSGFADKKVYVVQTSPVALERCLLMTTEPGDLVLDLTCGSGLVRSTQILADVVIGPTGHGR